jgi:ribosomal protein S1
MEQYLSSGESIEVRGVDVNRGGVIVDVDGLRGFIPSSQLLPEQVGKERSLINQKLTVKVIEQDRSHNRLVLAQKRVLPAAEEKKRLKAWKQIKTGDVVKAEVLSVTPLGAVVGIGKYLRAFLHLSEIAWEKVGNPSDYVSVGDVIEAKVIEKGADPDGLQVSLKQMGADPWQKVKDKYQEGQEITGRVTKRVPYGFFVELEPGVEGLIYLSKISGDLDLRAGEEVKCVVENVDAGARRIGLSVVREDVPVIYK